MPISPGLFRLRQEGRYGVDYTPEHERAHSPSSIPIKVRSPRSILRGTFCIIMTLMVASVNLFAFLNLAILVWEDCSIEWCVSRWKVELRGLDLGPAPSWLDDPPWDFDHLPPGADEYTNFSLDLSIKNNPEWLHVEILDVKLGVGSGGLAVVFTDDVAFNGAADVSIAKRVRFDTINEVQYLCPRRVPWGNEPFILKILFEARFSFLGRNTRGLAMETCLPLHALKSGASAREARSNITGLRRKLVWRCANLYHHSPDEIWPIAGKEFGEIVMRGREFIWSSRARP
ncbi:hypothetical protein FOZ62_027187 [Perkinsus olseni]|uniref:Uncharacterized protein n=1 Tax=Perkinsus olseni TaxID=32597 RepID=A0A7J6QIW2_PEROL|nr:hypothetical protein FOZ62_027187 [Perkinsus olseni]